MSNLNTSNTIGLNLELFHVQTNTGFELPANCVVFHIGKPNDQITPNIDVSRLPDANIVSRNHAQIQIHANNYFIEDLGSSNGTFVNNVKLEPRKPYQINLGDKINLGQEEKVTFIFQKKIEQQKNIFTPLNPTEIATQIDPLNRQTPVNGTTKFMGFALMVAGIVILITNVRVGIFFGIPGFLLCISGIFILSQRRIDPNLGWILIALGIVVITLTGNVFVSTSFLSIVCSFALLFAGYQLLNTGKVLNYDLRSLQNLRRK
ncbi:phosphopeptide-binding protein [Nostoc linckia z18]|uniref:Phosphopeptide-binding protein n=2 Tax=Nostoc linckia TaxID=92942 RepID=A0A9Q6EIS5_NOSLI|nr:FHA domain-containing protein [Nostoc linckia]PHK35905.1 phosphopeptide-binding protein [Nostoc linckia z15]PHK43710.1 phosphopeptide-binding protein [Nostoc linckia z16]PHJ55829.1 phosphopeptide-binding protein [Nostoc linckia z1]PHJ65349.1 phosphopeptide-binding protein [Nostoc linckia z3]PHJ66901.1 phosphopeptide-binding protein [Nostoc linckia z2]